MSLPTGIRNYTYAEDMAILRTRTHWVLLGVFLLLLFTAPLYLNDHWLGIVNRIGITIIAVTGLNILTGYCGQLSIGHAGFMAVGAYTSAVLTDRLGLPFLASLIFAGLSAGLIGMVFGMPSLRVKGFYLAITTIAAQFIIIWIIEHWTEVTGPNGIMDVSPASIGGIALKTPASEFYLILAITILTVYGAKNLARTKVGRAFVAIRDNDLAAEVMGINLFRYKLTAFFIGCFLAGLAGSLMAHTSRSISPDYFQFKDSILYVGMIIIGGLGTTTGPILGVVFIRLIDEFVTQLSPTLQTAFPNLLPGFTSGIAPMIFGLVIILFLIFEPRGLEHRWQLFKAAYRNWPFSY
ncbi:MAG: branched-chain amino acid ABC transporter permease [Dehalococcoidales bacterium]|nr:branched-chain amino acid ABC transporter permease [Dehalococcoidales bacterium]